MSGQGRSESNRAGQNRTVIRMTAPNLPLATDGSRDPSMDASVLFASGSGRPLLDRYNRFTPCES
jgi:hypothetical protein